MPFLIQKFVLLVEDEEIVTHIFERVFSDQSCALLDTTTSVKTALEKIAFVVYDYIFLDMSLDGVRYAGMEVLRSLARLKIKLRDEGQKTMDSRVIIMSGSVSLDDIMMEANALGVLSFIDKPTNFSEDYILGIVQQLGLPLLPRRTGTYEQDR